MAEMINNSPKLVSLGIRFRHGAIKLQPDQFFQSLEHKLSALRNLEMRGSFTIDWDGFIGQTSPLYHFLQRHPDLRAIDFSWDHSEHSCLVSATNPIFDGLFHSLREFGGMQLLCIQVVSSPRLSQQIERLRLVDVSSQPNPQLPANLKAFSRAVSLLPRLQHFEYSTYNYDTDNKSVDPQSLDRILAACPSLTILKIPYFPDQLVGQL